MRPILIFCFFIFCNYFSSAQDAVINPPIKFGDTLKTSSKVYCALGNSILVEGLLDERKPPYIFPNYSLFIPAKCTLDLENIIVKKYNSWRLADLSNMQSIANRYCSHTAGWVEKVEGTCKAGGPPPICPQDHWMNIGSSGGTQAHYNEVFKIKEKRKTELKYLQNDIDSRVCNCWTDDAIALKKRLLQNYQLDISNETNSNANNAATLDNFKMPCLDGCPEGYKCVDGFCNKFLSLEEKIINNNKVAKNYSLNVRLAELKKIKEWRSEIFKVWSNFNNNFVMYKTSELGLLESIENENTIDRFVRKTYSIKTNAIVLEQKYDEVVSLDTALPNNKVKLNILISNIKNLKSTLSKDLLLLQNYKEDIFNINNYGICKAMLSFYYESLWEYVNLVTTIYN